MIRLLRQFLHWPTRLRNAVLLRLKGVKAGRALRIRGRLYVRGSGNVELGDHVSINSGFAYNAVGSATHTSMETIGEGRIVIGHRVGLSNCVLSSRTSVTIGDDVLLGGGVQVFDHDFHSLIYHQRIQSPDRWIKSRAVVIEAGAFIGTRSILLKGTHIGARSVIGAGSVVSGTVPPDEIWAGNPAVFVKAINQQHA